jgi:hypothetical protein
MIVVEGEDFFSHDFRELFTVQPTAPVGCAHRQRHDVVLALKDLIWKVVPSSTLHP